MAGINFAGKICVLLLQYTLIMHNHAPPDYVCPICLGVQGVENDQTLIRQSDVVYKDESIMVFIASYFIGKYPGHLIVVPVEHYEHIYDLPENIASKLLVIAKKISIVMKKAYECDGVMMLQNNEPASGQHAFHYHLHIFPRYEGDNIFAYMDQKRETTVEERLTFVEKIRYYL